MLADETGRLSGGYRAPLITANVLLAGLLKCGAHPSLSVDGRFPGENRALYPVFMTYLGLVQPLPKAVHRCLSASLCHGAASPT